MQPATWLGAALVVVVVAYTVYRLGLTTSKMCEQVAAALSEQEKEGLSFLAMAGFAGLTCQDLAMRIGDSEGSLAPRANEVLVKLHRAGCAEVQSRNYFVITALGRRVANIAEESERFAMLKKFMAVEGKANSLAPNPDYLDGTLTYRQSELGYRIARGLCQRKLARIEFHELVDTVDKSAKEDLAFFAITNRGRARASERPAKASQNV